MNLVNKHKIRAIAIYLPQFHPIPENDEWWGKGFTEWTNVTKAKPLFRNHYQPHMPADLGFYDLRLSETREAQADLAKEYGIYGFCYYHYWFNGKRILERPFQEVFESGKPDFPFMLCWANENWTKTWDGKDKHILLSQKYSDEDDIAHIHYLIKFFKDPRYIKINGKPVIAIYKSGLIPNVEKTLDIWRNEALKENIELYICRFDCHEFIGREYIKGFDASIDFQPFSSTLHEFQKTRIFRRCLGKFFKNVGGLSLIGNKISGVIDYKKYVDFAITQDFPKYKIFPGLCPMWDNSSRKKRNYFILKGSNPNIFQKWLSSILNKFEPYSDEENFIFINAWNEWAEGNHMEPCQKWGRKYLENMKEALDKYQSTDRI